MPTANVTIFKDITNSTQSGTLGNCSWDTAHDGGIYVGRCTIEPLLAKCTQIVINFTSYGSVSNITVTLAVYFGVTLAGSTTFDADFAPPSFTVTGIFSKWQLDQLRIYESMYNLDQGKESENGSMGIDSIVLTYTAGVGESA